MDQNILGRTQGDEPYFIFHKVSRPLVKIVKGMVTSTLKHEVKEFHICLKSYEVSP